MLFEIFDRQGCRMEHTENLSCIVDSYEKGNLQSMNGNGYKFKLDGKLVSLSKLVETLNLKSNNRIIPNESKKLFEPNTIANTSNDNKSKRKVRKIRCITNNTTYKNMSACAKDLDIDPAAISYVMQKGTNKYKEYKFEFVEE